MIAGLAFYLFSTILLGASLGVVFSRNPVHSVLFLILAFFNAAALFVLLGAEFLAMLLVIVYVGAVAVLFLFVVMMLDVVPSTAMKLPKGGWQPIKKALFDIGFYKAWFIPVFLFVVYGLSFSPSLIQGAYGDFLLYHSLPVGLGILIWPTAGFSSLVVVSSWAIMVSAAMLAHATASRMSGVGICSACAVLFGRLPFSWIMAGILLCEFMVMIAFWNVSPVAGQVGSSPMPPHDLMNNTQALASLIYRYYAYVFEACGLILLVAMIGAIVLTLRKRTTMRTQDILTQVTRDPKKCVTLVNVKSGEGVGDVYHNSQ